MDHNDHDRTIRLGRDKTRELPKLVAAVKKELQEALEQQEMQEERATERRHKARNRTERYLFGIYPDR